VARFNEVLDQFGDAELPENFLASLMGAYDEDISIPAAKVDQVEKERDEALKKVNDLKALNFDLMRANGGGAGNNGSNNDEGNNSKDGDTEVVTIDDLFEKKG